MQELKRFQAIVSVCVVGIVLSFAGAVYTAVKEHHAKEAITLPEDRVPVPATAQ